MAVNKTYKPETNWNRTAFDKLKAAWSPERIAEDNEKLKEIFARAADCPLLAEALDWAERHDIEFFIDHQAVNVGGYYSVGTGVMAIVAKTRLPAEEVIVHEIRHAWQDYNGLLTWDDMTLNDGSFRDFFINNALIEADAYAVGQLAAAQVAASRAKKQLEKAPQPVPEWRRDYLTRQQEPAADESALLGKKFMSWFEGKYYPPFYGDFFSKIYGQKWGLYDKALPARNMEFKNEPPHRRGMDVRDIQDVLRLGVNFSGTKNYLAALQPDILPKRILRPSLADTFWGAANDDQKKLTAEIRKVCLKKKLSSKNPPKDHSRII